MIGRETEILGFLVRGLASKEIAARTDISESKVQGALQQLFAKTGVHTRAQLVRVALEQYPDLLPAHAASPESLFASQASGRVVDIHTRLGRPPPGASGCRPLAAMTLPKVFRTTGKRLADERRSVVAIPCTGIRLDARPCDGHFDPAPLAVAAGAKGNISDGVLIPKRLTDVEGRGGNIR